MIDLFQIAASIGGVGALLALVIFWMYRHDRKSSEYKLREDRRFMEDRLTILLEKDQYTRQENTKALTELIVLLSRLNGKLR